MNPYGMVLRHGVALLALAAPGAFAALAPSAPAGAGGDCVPTHVFVASPGLEARVRAAGCVKPAAADADAADVADAFDGCLREANGGSELAFFLEGCDGGNSYTVGLGGASYSVHRLGGDAGSTLAGRYGGEGVTLTIRKTRYLHRVMAAGEGDAKSMLYQWVLVRVSARLGHQQLQLQGVERDGP